MTNKPASGILLEDSFKFQGFHLTFRKIGCTMYIRPGGDVVTGSRFARQCFCDYCAACAAFITVVFSAICMS